MSEFVSGVHTPIPRSSEKEARRSAKTKAKEMKRATVTGDFEIVGNPAVRAGMEISFGINLPGIDDKKFMAKSVVHRFSKSGFVSAVSVELKV